jgi:glutamate-1-semialdehyde 2,1-aminomutase
MIARTTEGMMGRYDRSIALYGQALQSVAGGVTSNFRYGGAPVPLFFERGQGSRLTDVDGNSYIDYVLGNGPAILGHAPEPVIRAVAETLADGQVYAGQHRREIELAETLVRLIPCAELVRFASSGSEAIHAALRLARAFTGRPKIVKFEGHYHGWFDNIYVSVRPSLNEAGPASQPVPVAESPGQSEAVLGDVIVLGWNDLERLEDAFREHGGEIAGVIMEPVMCNSGVVPPAPGYLEGVRRLCSEHGALLIFDEVITGFRLGIDGAQGRFGVTPDLATFAKAIAAGFPLSAIAGRRDVMELVYTAGVVHGGTYNGNVQSLAASLAGLTELQRDEGAAYRRMEANGARLRDGLKEIADRNGVAAIVQGFGPIFALAFTDEEAITDYRSAQRVDLDRRSAFAQAMMDRGVRPTTRGTWFMSAAHSEADIDETLEAAEAAMRTLPVSA